MMKQIWNQTAVTTKVSLFFVGVGIACGISFVWFLAIVSGLTGNPPAPTMVKLVLVLLAVVNLQGVRFLWNSNVLPGILLSMCRITQASGTDKAFLDRCSPVVGDGFQQIAQRVGLFGMLRAFQHAQVKHSEQ